jgi:uncharacterized protein (TIGR03118 family)
VGEAGVVKGRVKQTNLTSDQAGMAAHTDTNLVNAWGLSINPQAAGGPAFWVSSTERGLSVVYDQTGTALPVVVTIPTPADAAAGSSPTGQAYNPTAANFMGDKFIFATEQGVIAGWQTGMDAVVRVDDSGEDASYKGLALVGTGAMATLLVTDFKAGKVAAYGTDYVEKESTTAFVDTSLPTGFAPFGIAELAGSVYVTYAKQDADKEDDVAGVGNGFIDVFKPDGTGGRRLVSGGNLNSPWGLAIAPSSFGDLAGSLLVGNFGDGFILAYDATTGVFRGLLGDTAGAPLQIDGLWALVQGPTGTTDLSQTLFFTAGPDDEAHGLFGKLDVGD